jgi:hypothetical protein
MREGQGIRKRILASQSFRKRIPMLPSMTNPNVAASLCLPLSLSTLLHPSVELTGAASFCSTLGAT